MDIKQTTERQEKIGHVLLLVGAILGLGALALLWHWMIWGSASATIREGLHAFYRIMLICSIVAVPSAILTVAGKAMLGDDDCAE